MPNPHDAANSLDTFEAMTPSFFEDERLEGGAAPGVLPEADETDLAHQLLEINDGPTLDRFLIDLITRATGEATGPEPRRQLRSLLRGTAAGVIPAFAGPSEPRANPKTGGRDGAGVAALADELFGLELEGGGAGEAEFENAHRFVRFAVECGKSLPHFMASAPSAIAARRAVGATVLQELYEGSRLPIESQLNLESSLLLADDQELDYFLGKLVRNVGRTVGNAARWAGRTVGKAAHAVSDLSSSVADTLGKVPLVGAGLKGLYGLSYGSLFQTIDNIARGVRLDKVVSRHFESQIRNIQEVAPYVQTIIGFVPGIGPGISGAISAGLSLAQGKPIDQVMIDAAIGAIPGGALAQTAVKAGVAAAQGKPIADVAFNALPMPPAARNAAKAAFHVLQDVAQGKRVDRALLAEADKQIQNLPPHFRKAAQVGIALGQGKKLQDIARQQIPGLVVAGGPLARLGQQLARVEPIVARARRLAGPATHGFDVAAGLMKHRLSPVEIARARQALSVRDRRGFDLAVALQGARVVSTARNRIQPGASTLPARAGRRPWVRELESIDELEFESGSEPVGEVDSSEEGEVESVFGESAEMELASQLLDLTDDRELDGFVHTLIARATGGTRPDPRAVPLAGLLRQAARRVLPMIGSATGNVLSPGVGSRLATAAGQLFGLELEGLSPEDQEFEVARRFVRFAGASARNSRRQRFDRRPNLAARRALGAAARRHAPGFLRRRRSPGMGPVLWPLEPAPDLVSPVPVPPAVTCHCGGTPPADPADPAPGDAVTGDGATPLPDSEPADFTEPQTQTSTENNMHDLDRTTMELTDEAADFEFPEAQDEYGHENAESTFSEEEEAEFASQLLEINDEAELDQFIGDLLRKARKAVGAALKSPLLQPLGGFIKGAIKKALPIAGSAVGNMIVPGLGGQIGSRLASGAGGLLGLELEGLAPEDQEFEVAKQLVRTVGTAVQSAAQSPIAASDPQAAAKAAMIAAAGAHLPGLLQPQTPTQTTPGARRPRSGRWYRRAGRIVLVGV